MRLRRSEPLRRSRNRAWTVRALVARCYDPQTATFLTTDPLEELTGTPYSYANDNPLNIEDPSGLCWFCLKRVESIGSGVALAAGAVAVASALVLTAPVSLPVGLAAAAVGSAALGTSALAGGIAAVASCTAAIRGSGTARGCAVGVAAAGLSAVGGGLLGALAPDIAEASLFASEGIDLLTRGLCEVADR